MSCSVLLAMVGTHRSFRRCQAQMKHGPFPCPGLCCPSGSSGTTGRSATLPAERDFANGLYALIASRARHPQARGRGGLPQFPHRPSDRSAPSTPGGSSPLRFQALRGFHGLRPEFPGSAPPCPLTGLASRGGRIHLTLRTGQLLPPQGAFDAGLRRRAFPPDAASLLPGALVLTGTGLPPAGRCELMFRSGHSMAPPPNSGHTNYSSRHDRQHLSPPLALQPAPPAD